MIVKNDKIMTLIKDNNKNMLRISYNNIYAESAYNLFSTLLKDHKLI